MKVGWIGPGNIGLLMAARVQAFGHDVTALVRRPEAAEEIRALGMSATFHLAEAVRDAEVVIVGLFDDAQLRDVLGRGLMSLMEPGAVLVVHTTGGAHLIEEMAATAPKGVMVLDATFSGDAKAVERGAVVLMAGGDTAAVEAARPVVQAYCNPILHLGPAGFGRRLKLVNNLLFAANITLAAEAVKAAQALGIDPLVAARAMDQCSGGSYGLRKFTEMPAQTVMAGIQRYLEKDVALAYAAAAEQELDIPLLRGATEVHLKGKGGG